MLLPKQVLLPDNLRRNRFRVRQGVNSQTGTSVEIRYTNEPGLHSRKSVRNLQALCGDLYRPVSKAPDWLVAFCKDDPDKAGVFEFLSARPRFPKPPQSRDQRRIVLAFAQLQSVMPALRGHTKSARRAAA